jgi:hypothetical protein
MFSVTVVLTVNSKSRNIPTAKPVFEQVTLYVAAGSPKIL